MLHHFVYAYALGSGALSPSSGEQGSVSYKTSLNSSGGGSVGSSIGNGNGRGSIVLDVVQASNPDGSAVFDVTENGFNGGKSFMCAAYGATGNVVCNSGQPPRTELLVLLRVAGAGFYEPGQLDANKHWHIDSPGPNLSETADFTVKKTAGTLVTIAMRRRGTQRRPAMQTSIDGTIVYDTSQDVPASIDATIVLTPQGGPPQTTHVDLALQR